MTIQTIWDTMYQTKAPDAVSWYRPDLERSIELIQAVIPDLSTSIIDVWGRRIDARGRSLGKRLSGY